MSDTDVCRRVEGYYYLQLVIGGGAVAGVTGCLTGVPTLVGDAVLGFVGEPEDEAISSSLEGYKELLESSVTTEAVFL